MRHCTFHQFWLLPLFLTALFLVGCSGDLSHPAVSDFSGDRVQGNADGYGGAEKGFACQYADPNSDLRVDVVAYATPVQDRFSVTITVTRDSILQRTTTNPFPAVRSMAGNDTVLSSDEEHQLSLWMLSDGRNTLSFKIQEQVFYYSEFITCHTF